MTQEEIKSALQPFQDAIDKASAELVNERNIIAKEILRKLSSKQIRVLKGVYQGRTGVIENISISSDFKIWYKTSITDCSHYYPSEMFEFVPENENKLVFL